MGFLDDAKETAEAAAKKVGRAVEDGIDRAKDKVDELKAEGEVKKAEAERDAVKARNDAKEGLREDQ
ncbi:hypothetical protein [Leucobacter massiliensis]|uniref:Uncharacterized protein n=1 Tax=Leucobacter massiliensis TaxID=1686285 RepID=A0A2S9QS77_9MICO|nr:hypothetical protein [Leucobacter massiliensis]PRI12422.1 hypothetical protein B4915_01775 [Leucobacter massiliensis]